MLPKFVPIICAVLVIIASMVLPEVKADPEPDPQFYPSRG
uniref:Venom peptide n=1 Tax=Dasymutilla sicheliana TaxID=1175388 RepID=A0A8T9VJU6_DASSI|nr:venom peptide precursor [Dasymutilla sicheliana]